MKKTLIIHRALPPYRADFFNGVAQKLTGVHIYFLFQQMPCQPAITCDQFEKNYPYTVGSKRVFSHSLRKVLTCFFSPMGIIRLGELLGLPKLVGLVVKMRPEVVVTNGFQFLTILLVAYCRVFKRKHIAWVDDSMDNVMQSGWFRRLRIDFVLRRSEGLIVCNPQVRDYFREQVNIRVESVEILQVESVFRRRLDRSIDLANRYIRQYQLVGKKVLLFVGRLETVKNLEKLIEAFSHADSANTILVIVGGGTLSEKLKEKVSVFCPEERKVLFFGSQYGESLLAWYLIGKLFVLPSIYEPFGAVVNEALLSGMPVLCSRHAGASCLINPGQNGEVFDPSDDSAFIDVLNRWIGKTEPSGSNVSVHESLMEASFADCVEKFVSMCR